MTREHVCVFYYKNNNTKVLLHASTHVLLLLLKLTPHTHSVLFKHCSQLTHFQIRTDRARPQELVPQIIVVSLTLAAHVAVDCFNVSGVTRVPSTPPEVPSSFSTVIMHQTCVDTWPCTHV